MMTVIRFDLTETEREQKILLTLKEISFNQRGSHSESFGNALINILQVSLVVLILH